VCDFFFYPSCWWWWCHPVLNIYVFSPTLIVSLWSVVPVKLVTVYYAIISHLIIGWVYLQDLNNRCVRYFIQARKQIHPRFCLTLVFSTHCLTFFFFQLVLLLGITCCVHCRFTFLVLMHIYIYIYIYMKKERGEETPFRLSINQFCCTSHIILINQAKAHGKRTEEPRITKTSTNDKHKTKQG
jgi:hypothetical protein